VINLNAPSSGATRGPYIVKAASHVGYEGQPSIAC
jgi:hypothetical protein